MVFAQNGTLNLGNSITWPAQHDWLRRYCVFERATYALEEIVAARMCIYFNSLQRKNAAV